jgi:general secretion pathway protein G
VRLSERALQGAAALAQLRAALSPRQKLTAARVTLVELEGALALFDLHQGRYPSQEEGLAALVTRPAGVKAWRGPYFRGGLPLDPWGNPYVYRFPGREKPQGYDLFSTGPDGRERGGDDVTSRDEP